MTITKTEIVELENKLIEGIKKSDITFLDKVLHNDLLFLAPNGQAITKAMDLASHQAGEMVVEQLIPTIEELKNPPSKKVDLNCPYKGPTSNL